MRNMEMTWLTTLLERPPIGWWDVADILLVSFVIYEVLKLIRGTRAVLGQLAPEAMSAFVDVAGLGPGRYSLPVRTEPHEDIAVTGMAPSAIQVRIK